MKIFTIGNDKHRVYFQNLQRTPLNEEFQNIVSELVKNGYAIGSKKKAGTADIYPCLFLIEGDSFDLIYDETDDGTSIYLQDETTLEKLKSIFDYMV